MRRRAWPRPMPRSCATIGLSTRANHLLFDLAGEVLARSRAVVVHSRFALRRLRLTHGEAATAPCRRHPAPAAAGGAARPRRRPRPAGHSRRGFPGGDRRLRRPGQAAGLGGRGAGRRCRASAGSMPVASIRARPRPSADRATVTGHLEAAALRRSHRRRRCAGEPALPFAAAKAPARSPAASPPGSAASSPIPRAYAELPRDAVIHLPLAGGAGALAAALAGLRRRSGAGPRPSAPPAGATPWRRWRWPASPPATATSSRHPATGRWRPSPAAPRRPPLLRAPAEHGPPSRRSWPGGSGACRLRLEVPDLARAGRPEPGARRACCPACCRRGPAVRGVAGGAGRRCCSTSTWPGAG